MKRTVLIPVLIILVAITSFKCRRSNEGATLTGRLVVNTPCGHFVVQLIKGNVEPGRLVQSWTDSIAHKTWSNVFTVANACHFEGAGFATGDTFTFKMNDTLIVNNCMLCAVFHPTPAISNTVSHVRRIDNGQ
jgi:hypothetical protein